MLGGDIPCGDALAVDDAVTCGPVPYTVTASDAKAGAALVNTASVVANEGEVDMEDPTSADVVSTPVDVLSETIENTTTTTTTTTTSNVAPTTTAKSSSTVPAQLSATGSSISGALGIGLLLVALGTVMAMIWAKKEESR